MYNHSAVKASFSERAKNASHPLTSYLFRLMDLKASNLCLSADVSTARELLYLADRIGPSIVVFKTHHDMVSGWDYSPQTGTGARLATLARKHGFLIFEDRKFGDIGNTVQLQYTGGEARIIEWAHIVNVNMVPGPAVVTALDDAAKRWRERYPYEVKTLVSVGTPNPEHLLHHDHGDQGEHDDQASSLAAGGNTTTRASGSMLRSIEGRKASIVSVTTVTQHYEPAASPRGSKILADGEVDEELYPGIEEAPVDRGLLILAQMSSKGNFMGKEYTDACVQTAREHKRFVIGFVSQESLNSEVDDSFIHMTPGCQLPPPGSEANGVHGDGKGQQYNTPQKLVEGAGVDIVIVGRGILQAANPQSEAERYRREAWRAYKSRTEKE